MKTASYVKSIERWRGDARVYRLSEPHEGYEHVIVSGVSSMISGPETYIFGADESLDDVADWLELEGSFQGGIDHAEALRNAGYMIAGGDDAS